MKLFVKFTHLLIAVLIIAEASAQYVPNKPQRVEKASDYIPVSQPIDGLIIVKHDTGQIRFDADMFTGEGRKVPIVKYGIVNTAGEIVVSPKFDYIEDFRNGLAKVGIYNMGILLYGYINKAGKEIVPIKYNAIGDFKDGLAFARLGIFLSFSRPNCQTGYYNMMGQMVIPMNFQMGTDFQNGEATVILNGRWGIINTKGTWIRDLNIDQPSQGLGSFDYMLWD